LDSEEYQNLLKKFPKVRPALDQKFKDIYKEHYTSNRGGNGLTNFISQKMESWMHKKTATISGKNILELGAGNLNHMKYEKSYDCYDIVEPFSDLYKGSPRLPSVKNIFNTLEEISDDHRYDKIITVATLEHLVDLPKEIKICKKLLKREGRLQIAIPCEGEFAFKLGWMLTTAIAFRLKYKLDYSKLIKYEHINSIDEILIILKNNFKITKFERSPLLLPFKNLSFYAYIECMLD
tara:strand:- start:97 stop:804 length:708 start_codon:yes stop_codon:yes gene_type:complete